MEQDLVGIFEQGLRSVVGVIKGRVSKVEIDIVNDNLESSFDIKKELEESFELRPVRQLDEDEVLVLTYVKMQEKSLKSNSHHLRVMEGLTQEVLRRMMEIHFYNIITSNDIKARIVEFVITNGFFLNALLEKKDAISTLRNFERRLDQKEQEVFSLLFDVFESLGNISDMRQEVGCLGLLEQIADARKCSEKDKSIRPFALKKEVIDCVQQVYVSYGTFIATEHGWLPIRRGGKLYKDYPVAIPFSSQNDNIVFTFYPKLKK